MIQAKAGGEELRSLRGRQQAIVKASLRALGPDHPDTVTAQNNLGATLLKLSDLTLARQAFSAALKSAARLSPRHPSATIAAWGLYLVFENEESERDAVMELVKEYLAWLMTAGATELTSEQQNIAEQFSGTPDGMFWLLRARLTAGRPPGDASDHRE